MVVCHSKMFFLLFLCFAVQVFCHFAINTDSKLVGMNWVGIGNLQKAYIQEKKGRTGKGDNLALIEVVEVTTIGLH